MGSFEHIITVCIPDWVFYRVKEWMLQGLITAAEYLQMKEYLISEKIITTCTTLPH